MYQLRHFCLLSKVMRVALGHTTMTILGHGGWQWWLFENDDDVIRLLAFYWMVRVRWSVVFDPLSSGVAPLAPLSFNDDGEGVAFGRLVTTDVFEDINVLLSSFSFDVVVSCCYYRDCRLLVGSLHQNRVMEASTAPPCLVIVLWRYLSNSGCLAYTCRLSSVNYHVCDVNLPQTTFSVSLRNSASAMREILSCVRVINVSLCLNGW